MVEKYPLSEVKVTETEREVDALVRPPMIMKTKIPRRTPVNQKACAAE